MSTRADGGLIGADGERAYVEGGVRGAGGDHRARGWHSARRHGVAGGAADGSVGLAVLMDGQVFAKERKKERKSFPTSVISSSSMYRLVMGTLQTECGAPEALKHTRR